ncbi:caspase-8-like isoform X2 [Ptychodera flava]|uniref:caspase-8-like isoform X2 n=1 Tax=Ptychodera flava TaxID=63121 RepID=UPI00396A4A6D
MYCTDAQSDLSYRKVLKSVDENLMARDLNSLKFLCRDFIPAGKLESARKARDVFQELEFKGYLGPGDKLYFLAELLVRIHRVDLIKKLGLGRPRDVQVKLNREGRPGPQFSKFRLLLLTVCDNLTSDDLDTIKFYCQPFISKGNMDDMNDAPSLLSYLEHSARIGDDDVDFLVEMLDSLDNEELCRKVKSYQASISSSSSEAETKLLEPMQPQHRMVPSGRGIHDIPMRCPPPAYSETPPLLPPAAFTTGRFPNNYTVVQPSTGYLPQQFQQQHRYIGVTPAVPDARISTPIGGRTMGQATVEEPPNEVVTPQSHTPQQPLENMPSHQSENEVAAMEPVSGQPQQPHENLAVAEPSAIQVQGRRNDLRQPQGEGDSMPLTEQSGQEKPPDHGSLPLQQPEENMSQDEFEEHRRAVMARMERLYIEQEKIEMPSYRMSTSPLGLCIIINNENFYVNRDDPLSRRLDNRTGTAVDRDNLFYVFRKLDFDLEVKNDLTAFGMIRWLQDIGRQTHSHYSCFVCCILSHGSKGSVYGADGVPVDVADLTRCVKGSVCPTLNGKPKLFFMQACQGRTAQRGATQLETDSENEQPADTIPNEADFLLGYATVPGFVSYRSKSQGSWYITKLVECIDTYHDRYDLLSIMVKVNEEVSKAIAKTQEGARKQVPAPLVTLRKKVFLKPVQKPVV